jgi:hypothetical protein
LVGKSTNPVILSARGALVATPGFDVAIQSLTIHGSVTDALIQAGYNTKGQAADADAQIGNIVVDHDWVSSIVAVGTGPGSDNLYGTADDAELSGVTNTSTLSKIASIQIGGTVKGTVAGGDHYGFIADEIDALSVAGSSISLHSGPHNDDVPLGSTADVDVREVGSSSNSGTAVTVNQASGQADPTASGPINFTVVFANPLPAGAFTSSDVTISGTAGGTLIADVTGNGTTYNVAVSGMTTSGTVSVSVAGDVVTDVTDIPNAASTSSDNVVYFDNTPPTATLTSTPSDNSTGNVSFSFTGSDNYSSPGALTFMVQLDSGAPTAAESSVSYHGLSAGPHTFSVWAIDQAGNVGTLVSFSWTVAPPLSFVLLPDGALYEHQGTDPNSGWTGLTTGVAQVQVGIDATGSPTAFVLFTGGFLWEHTSAGWTSLTSNVSSISASQVAPNTVFVVFNGGYLWEEANGSWTSLTSNVSSIAAGVDGSGAAAVFVLFTGGFLWEHSNAGWTSLTTNVIGFAASQSSANTVFVVFNGGYLWERLGSSWTSLASNVAQVASS